MRDLIGGVANTSIIVIMFGVITALDMSWWYIIPAGLLGFSVGTAISTIWPSKPQ